MDGAQETRAVIGSISEIVSPLTSPSPKTDSSPVLPPIGNADNPLKVLEKLAGNVADSGVGLDTAKRGIIEPSDHKVTEAPAPSPPTPALSQPDAQPTPTPPAQEHTRGRMRDFQNERIWPFLAKTIGMRFLHARAVAKYANFQKGQSVLELGGNTSVWPQYCDRVGEKGRFVVIDNNPKVVQNAQEVLEKLGSPPNVEVMEADAAHLPFGENDLQLELLRNKNDRDALEQAKKRFDTVIASNLTAGADLEKSMREALRVLNPGGKVLWSWSEPVGIPFFTFLHALTFRRICADMGEGYKVKIRPGLPQGLTGSWNWFVIVEKP